MTAEFDIPLDFEEQDLAVPPPEVGLQLVEHDGLMPLAKRTSIPGSTWSPKLVFELALGIADPQDIMTRHNLTPDDLEFLYSNRMFRAEVSALSLELQKDGVTLRTKARMQAEEYLEVLDGMVHDIHTTSSVRLSCIQQVCKLGDVEPKKDSGGISVGESFNIQININ